MQRTCRGGRQDRTPSISKLIIGSNQHRTLQTKGGAAEPSLVGVAFFRFSSCQDILGQDMTYSLRSVLTPLSLPLDFIFMKHEHSSLDVSEETVVICVPALYHKWTFKEEKSKTQPWSARVCLQRSKTPQNVHEARNQNNVRPDTSHSAFSSAVYITIISKAQEPS